MYICGVNAYIRGCHRCNFVTQIAPSSSKFIPKRHRKDNNFQWLFLVFLGFWLKTHQLLMTFPCVFRFLTKRTRKNNQKLTSFGLNFEDEGAKCSLNFVNLKWQVVEHVVKGPKRPFWKLLRLSCKNDLALHNAKVGSLHANLTPPNLF